MLSTIYEQPQFDADPDDTPPTLDTRHRSTLGRVRNRAKATTQEHGCAPVRRGSSDALMVNDDRPGTVRRLDGFFDPKSAPHLPINKPVYAPSLTVWAYMAVALTLAAVVVLWLCAGRPALTGWQM